MVSIVVAVAYLTVVAFENVANLSDTLTLNWWPAFFFGKNLRMSIATNSSGPIRGNRSILRCLFILKWLRAHDRQSRTVAYVSFAM